jgi:hypothetical protein
MRQALFIPLRPAGRSLFLDRWSRKMLSNDTYYDSQSGLHLPNHNQKEIAILLDVSKKPLGRDTLVPAQLYKDDSSDVPDKLQALRQAGVTGLWLPPAMFPRDMRNLRTLHHVAPPGFRFFISVPASPPKDLTTVSIMHEFNPDLDTKDLQKVLEHNAQNGIHTTLRLGESFCGDIDAVSAASQLAALIDNSGGVDCIWITPSLSANEDDVVQLCEELTYLDVAGATIKSRIIIDSVKEEIINETMLIGINKFVVKEDIQIDIVGGIANAHGKELLFA